MRIPRDFSSSACLKAVVDTQLELAVAGLDLNKVLDVVVTRAQSITAGSGAAIELAEGDETVYRAACGIAKAALGTRQKNEAGLSGLCLRVEQPLKCDDALNDDRVNKDLCLRLNARSVIVTPLRHANRSIGVLKVLSTEPNAFDEMDVQTLQIMSGLVAAALSHAAAYQQKSKEAESLFHLATHDLVTGLANRALFLDRVNHALAVAKRDKSPLAVLILDMDKMKVINDTYGHHAGDRALQEVGMRMRRALREADTIARIGGDEFAILPSGVRDPESARIVCQRIAKFVEAPFILDGQTVQLSISIGFALYSEDGTDTHSLMRAADAAMYKNKHSHRQ